MTRLRAFNLPPWLGRIMLIVTVFGCCALGPVSVIAMPLPALHEVPAVWSSTIWSPPMSWHLATLQFGSEGTAVEQLQSRLKTLGYLEGEVNGIYDDATQTAVQAFQQDRALRVDGITGPNTQQQLADLGTQRNSLRAEMPQDIQRIFDRGKLIVALLGQDNPPFFMTGTPESHKDNRQATGLDIKIAEGLASALGVELEFNRSPTTFNEVVDQVYQLEADIAISKLSRTLTRSQRVQFSHPYVTMRQALLVNRLQLTERTQGNRVVEAIRTFDGKVGVIQGSSYVSFIKQRFPDAIIQEYPTWDDIVVAVIRGDIQAAYRDELEIKKVVRQNPEAALRLQTIALNDTKDQIAMALPWDSNHLQAFVNQYLDTFDLDYTADLVLDEYADVIQTDGS